jgi:predicted esterase
MLKKDNVMMSVEFNCAEKILLFLHGYGSSWQDFPEVNKNYLSTELKNTVICAPNAPLACDVGHGYQWFRLSNMSHQEIRRGLDTISTMLTDYIDGLANTFRCTNVIVAGFSQGAMVSFDTLYRSKNVSKIVAYAGMFVPPDDTPIIAESAKVLIVHSMDDQAVPYVNADLAKSNLEALGISTEVVTYTKIGHSISLESLAAGVRFINETRHLPNLNFVRSF